MAMGPAHRFPMHGRTQTHIKPAVRPQPAQHRWPGQQRMGSNVVCACLSISLSLAFVSPFFFFSFSLTPSIGGSGLPVMNDCQSVLVIAVSIVHLL